MENINYFFHVVYMHFPIIYGLWVIVHVLMYLIGEMPIHFDVSYGLPSKPKNSFARSWEEILFLKRKWKVVFFLLVTTIPILGWWITTKLIKVKVIESHISNDRLTNIYVRNKRIIRFYEESSRKILLF